MLEFSKRLGLCLGMAAAFCLGACGDDDSSSDKGKTNSGGNSDVVECENNDDCKDVEGKPVCDQDKKECVEEKKDEGNGDAADNDKECEKDEDCKDESKECKDNKCVTKENSESTDEEKPECIKDEDCTGDNQKCSDKKCVAKEDSSETGEETGEGGQEQEKQEAECGAGEVKCGETCTNTFTDKNNCGDCGKTCDEGKTCNQGQCIKECSTGEACGDECIDLDSDAKCGTCSDHKACQTDKGEICQNRACVSACTKEGEVWCDNKCVNFQTDKDNCGGCGKEFACGEGKVCLKGQCKEDCGELINCDGNCVEKTNPNYCGADAACENYSVCGEGETCSDSGCVCTQATDKKCVISENETVCVDPKTNPTYCGCDERESGAGVNCETLTGTTAGTCVDGKCQITCNEAHGDCDNNVNNGCETELNTVDNCGACGTSCVDANADSASCSNGKCEYVCKNNMVTCNGHCIDVQNDKNNCGWCGNVCEDSECVNGFCTRTKECTADEEGDLYMTTKVNGQDIKAFCIQTAAQFDSIANAINAGGKYPTKNGTNHFIVISDIDFGTKSNYTPIGTSGVPYSGVFLGNGKLIKGTLSKDGSTSLFGYIKNAVISDVNMKLDFTSAHSSAGLVYNAQASVINNVNQSGTAKGAGNFAFLIYSVNGSNLSYIRTSGSVTCTSNGPCSAMIGTATSSDLKELHSDVQLTATDAAIGGLISYIAGNTILSDSSSSGDITSTGTRTAGLIGTINASADAQIIRCHSSGKITNTAYRTGGLVGGLYSDGQASSKITIKDSYSTSDIQGNLDYVGGLVGKADEVIIDNSFTTGNIIGMDGYNAGLLGYANKATITKSYTTGNVTIKSGHWAQVAGGLVGRIATEGTITDSYATGNVISEATQQGNHSCGTSGAYGTCMGGLAGQLNKTTVSNCYATGNVSGSAHLGGLIGEASNSRIENSYSKGDIKATYVRNGGVVGQINATDIINCAYFGKKIEGKHNELGGITGFVVSGNVTISNSYSMADSITSTGGNYFGGVVGRVETSTTKLNIRNVYTMGTVAGPSSSASTTGSFVGTQSASNSLSIKSSYYAETLPKVIYNGQTAIDASAIAFKYDENDNAILSDGSKKLVDALGQDWTVCDRSITTTTQSGPGLPVTTTKTYHVPTLKIFGSVKCD